MYGCHEYVSHDKTPHQEQVVNFLIINNVQNVQSNSLHLTTWTISYKFTLRLEQGFFYSWREMKARLLEKAEIGLSQGAIG